MSGMINAGLMSSETDEWATPQELFDELHKKYRFNTDVCATKYNRKCSHYFSKEENGLLMLWSGTCWMNPPYGREIGKWVEKAWNETKFGVLTVALLPARTDTKWFHDWIYTKDNTSVEFIKGRVKFGGAKWNAPFPSMIVEFKPINI